MNIQILDPDKFIALDKKIYIKDSISNTLGNTIIVWSGGQESPRKINAELAMSPSDLEIEMYLQNNGELRELALELDLIYMRDADIISYLNYCNSYK